MGQQAVSLASDAGLPWTVRIVGYPLSYFGGVVPGILKLPVSLHISPPSPA
jgi:hypothetical protein